MKITDENLKLIKVNKNGNFTKIDTGVSLYYFDSCKKCGESYLAQQKNKGYCSKQCSILDNEKMYNVSGENNGFYGHSHNKETKQINRDKHLGKKFSKEYCKSISQRIRGSGNPNWKGGIKDKPYSDDWTEDLRKYIRIRDNGKCQFPYCEYKNFVQCVHHIDEDKLNCQSSNLITLCQICHAKVHGDINNGYQKLLMNIVKN